MPEELGDIDHLRVVVASIQEPNTVQLCLAPEHLIQGNPTDQVLVVFREESEGQEGLRKVVEKTKTKFILALDTNTEQTKRYNPGDQVHDSYIIDSDGLIRAILAGTRYDRAQPDEIAKSLNDLMK